MSPDVTMDVSVHHVDDNGTVKELHRASGGPWGVACVSNTFIALLTQIFGKDIMMKLKDDDVEAYSELLQTIQTKLSQVYSLVDRNTKYTVRIPVSLVVMFEKITKEDVSTKIENLHLKDDIECLSPSKLRVSAKVVLSWFQAPINNGIGHLSGILSDPSMNDVDTIILVGEFAKCPLLKTAVKEAFMNKTIVIPKYPEQAVLSGAVVCGHQGNK